MAAPSSAELRLDVGDFDFTTKLGDGSFSEVFKGSLKKRMSNTHPLRQYGEFYACKLINRRSLEINRQSKQFIGAVLREKQALYKCKNISFTLQLHATAKNHKYIAFITELCSNGDLLQYLHKYNKLSIQSVKYYGSCIVSVVNKLHNLSIIHRDIKPENIMLNDKFQPILSDFGCVKLLSPPYKSETSKYDPDFVGTPQFMAPELITIPKSLLMQTPQELLYGKKKKNNDDNNDNSDDSSDDDDDDDDDDGKENQKYFNLTDGRLKNEYYKCLDFWSLGCLLYQLRTGNLLFNEATEFLVFKEVKTMNFTLNNINNNSLKDLLKNLLIEEPMDRIGVNDINNLKNHQFFHGIDWNNLVNITPPSINDLNNSSTTNDPNITNNVIDQNAITSNDININTTDQNTNDPTTTNIINAITSNDNIANDPNFDLCSPKQ